MAPHRSAADDRRGRSVANRRLGLPSRWRVAAPSTRGVGRTARPERLRKDHSARRPQRASASRKRQGVLQWDRVLSALRRPQATGRVRPPRRHRPHRPDPTSSAPVRRAPASPPDFTRGELDRRVEAVLDALDLADRAEVPIGRLSGGQRKRASVGVELIGRPAALFLDEPTAGLDPGVARRLVRTCRGLAREGRVVVFATHVMEDIEQFDRVAVLAGGRLAYFGPPTGMLEHFGASSYAEVYDRLEERPAKDLARQFAGSVPGQEVRAAVAMESRPQPLHNQELPSPSPARTGVRQWAVLSARFLRTLVADPSHTGVCLHRSVGHRHADVLGLQGIADHPVSARRCSDLVWVLAWPPSRSSRSDRYTAGSGWWACDLVLTS